MLEAERIVVDEVAKIAPEGRDSRSARFASSLESAATATTALRDRLAVVLEYLRAVKDGRAVLDRDVLREVAKAMVVLRTSSSEALREDFADEYENTLVLNYLAAMTKTTDGLSEAIDKFHIVHGDHSLVTATRFHTRGRGMPPTPGHDLI
jgi:COP9 signalosome complex subunit 6